MPKAEDHSNDKSALKNLIAMATKTVKNDSDSFSKFYSCGIEELKRKVMAEPQKFKDESVFVANKA